MNNNFLYSNLSVEELKSISLVVEQKLNNCTIEGVYYKKLTTFPDGRGDLTELWSKPWIEKEPMVKEVQHVYYNTTHEGITKAWHVHEKTYSQYTCVKGKMQVILVDVRKDSKTFGEVNHFIIGALNPSFIVIPPGVLKGWKSLKGDSVIINLLSSADVADNFKYPWDSILSDLWQPKNG